MKLALRTAPVPWMAYVLGLTGAGMLLGADEVVFRVLGLILILAGAGWLQAQARQTRMLVDRLLGVLPIQDKSESLFRELPRAWRELEQENLALKHLADQEDRLRHSLLAHLKTGIILLDPDRKVRLFNPAAEQILGRSSRLFPDGTPLTIFREPEPHRLLEKAFLGEASEWNLHRDPRIIRARALPMRGLKGVEGSVLLTLEDITRQEALESTRQKFISNASHELKTPVTSIRIAAENLVEGGLVMPEGETSLQSILRAVERMTLLLNDISELSRIETGALELKPEWIEMEAYLEALLEDLQPQARQRRIRLRPRISESLKGFRFEADPFRLNQLLENLLSNAIKFSPEDSEVLLAVDREGQELICSVIDQGPGIAPSEAQRIFERFYRSPQARGIPGTGLGLAIVKHLSAVMGGDVALKSELGQGATFTLRLPLAENRN